MSSAATGPMVFAELRSGTRARITDISGDGSNLQRLQEMGLTVGTIFRVVKVAPFGDPVEIDLRGYRLCLRRAETVGIGVEILP